MSPRGRGRLTPVKSRQMMQPSAGSPDLRPHPRASFLESRGDVWCRGRGGGAAALEGGILGRGDLGVSAW